MATTDFLVIGGAMRRDGRRRCPAAKGTSGHDAGRTRWARRNPPAGRVNSAYLAFERCAWLQEPSSLCHHWVRFPY